MTPEPEMCREIKYQYVKKSTRLRTANHIMAKGPRCDALN